MPENEGVFKLFDEMQLQEFADKILIRCTDSAFSIDRNNGDIQPLTIGDSSFGTPIRDFIIYGVVGTIRLLAGTYLLVITSRKEVGIFLGFPVFRVMSMKFMACNEILRLSTYQEKRDEAYFMSLLRTVESTPGLYYSYQTDLTLNLQQTWKLAAGRAKKPLWKQADPRFVWNKNLLEDLIECKLDAFVMPLIQGSFQTVDFTLKSSPAKVTLISRRCTRRLGTRMWRRGANLEGDTANFIETEQLLEIEGFKSSFLQPKVVERHFLDLTQRYGEIMALDLTDNHGDEGQLSMSYANEMQKVPYVRYVSYDFHHYNGKSELDNLQPLYDEISEDFEKKRYFLIDSRGEILVEQKGVVRSNCIDCLDRTNVTQSYLARKSLNSQLQKIGSLSSSECISMFNDIYDKFKIIWAQQGDEISLEYAGTSALKGDLVRFGKQTFSGLIKDGMSALSRYYQNNFQDGIRQDAIDLISGRYTVNINRPSPFQLNGFESISYLPVASAFVITGVTLTSITFNQVGRNAQHFVSSVVWAGLAAGAMAVVKANGRQFCSRPQLCGLL
ncbi:Phosphoinositide phosphatase sac8 [Ranunculus cassubicifolius]